MDKKTVLILAALGVGVAAYFIYKKSQDDKAAIGPGATVNPAIADPALTQKSAVKDPVITQKAAVANPSVALPTFAQQRAAAALIPIDKLDYDPLSEEPNYFWPPSLNYPNGTYARNPAALDRWYKSMESEGVITSPNNSWRTRISTASKVS